MQQRLLIVTENGLFKGAAFTSDNGNLLPLDTVEGLAAVIPDFNAALIAENAALQARHEERVTELIAEHAAAIESLRAEHAAEIERIRAEVTVQSPSILAMLDQAFETLVPAELQTQFEPAWGTVRNLMQAGKIARAAAFVRALPVPMGLESVREQIASMIDGGA